MSLAMYGYRESERREMSVAGGWVLGLIVLSKPPFPFFGFGIWDLVGVTRHNDSFSFFLSGCCLFETLHQDSNSQMYLNNLSIDPIIQGEKHRKHQKQRQRLLPNLPLEETQCLTINIKNSKNPSTTIISPSISNFRILILVYLLSACTSVTARRQEYLQR
jgi:hypothetical protein